MSIKTAWPRFYAVESAHTPGTFIVADRHTLRTIDFKLTADEAAVACRFYNLRAVWMDSRDAKHERQVQLLAGGA